MKHTLPQGEKPFPEIKRDMPKSAAEVKALVERVKKSFKQQQEDVQEEYNANTRRSDSSSGYVL